MATEVFSNFVNTTLAGSIGPGATTFTVASGTGASLPQPAAGQFGRLIFTDQLTGAAHEIITYTSISGDTVSGVTRGSSPLSWSAGDIILCGPTAQTMQQFTQGSQAQSNSATYAPDTGSANAYVISPSPAISGTPDSGTRLYFKAVAANTGASTLSVNGTLYPLVGNNGALAANEIVSNGNVAVAWNSTYSGFQLLGCTGGEIAAPNATSPGHAINLGQADSRYAPLGSGGRANGQCRLSKSGANIVLLPFNGNGIIIDNTSQTIPSAGVSLAPTGLISLTSTTTRSISSNVATLGHAALASAIPVGTNILVRDVGGAAAYNGLKIVTASTTTSTSYAAVAANEASTADTNGRILPSYYVYAYMNSGVMTLEASTVGHSIDASSGVEIKTGDATRSLVGMAALVSGAFVDTTTQHFVLSWFNRTPFVLRNNFTANRTTSSSTAIEINPEIRIDFLSFSGEALRISAVGSAAVSAGGGGSTGEGFVMLDGTAAANTLPGTSNQLQVPGNGGGIQLHSFAIQRLMTEGAHFVTMGGDVGGGSSITFTGGSNPNAYQLYVGS